MDSGAPGVWVHGLLGLVAVEDDRWDSLDLGTGIEAGRRREDLEVRYWVANRCMAFARLDREHSPGRTLILDLALVVDLREGRVCYTGPGQKQGASLDPDGHGVDHKHSVRLGRLHRLDPAGSDRGEADRAHSAWASCYNQLAGGTGLDMDRDGKDRQDRDPDWVGAR